MATTRRLHGGSTATTRRIHGDYTATTRRLHDEYTATTRRLHRDYTATKRLSSFLVVIEPHSRHKTSNQCLRRLTNVKPTLLQRLVPAGLGVLSLCDLITTKHEKLAYLMTLFRLYWDCIYNHGAILSQHWENVFAVGLSLVS